MLCTLLLFVQERYTLKAAIPLALLLSLGPLSVMSVNALVAIVVTGWVFLVLLILRIVDDITSIEEDKQRKPKRKLVNGSISPKLLQLNLLWLVLFVVFIGVFLDVFWLTVGLLIFYFFYFLIIKPLKYILLDAYLINVVFFFIPVLAVSDVNDSAIYSIISMAFFYWSSAIAHDFAHSVESKIKTKLHWHAVFVYLISFCIGISLAFKIESSVIFLGILTGGFTYICLLLIRLIKWPNEKSAKAFYIAGYLYFLIPAAALFIENKLMSY